MAINRSVSQQPVSVAEAQLARVAGEGCARHAHLNALARGVRAVAASDLADAVHLLCSLHGRYPGLIEIALQRCAKGEARPNGSTAQPRRSSASGSTWFA